jgi:hypothetical protein
MREVRLAIDLSAKYDAGLKTAKASEEQKQSSESRR